MRKLQRLGRGSTARTSVLIVFLLSFGTIGSYILTHSFAATPYVSIEAEMGTKTGNVIPITDSYASFGNAVQFATLGGSVGKK